MLNLKSVKTQLIFYLLFFAVFLAVKERDFVFLFTTLIAIISLLLFGTQAILQKVFFWAIFGYFSWFYIFVMVIEPKTTPRNSTRKYIFGAGTAALVFVLTESGVKFDAELFSCWL